MASSDTDTSEHPPVCQAHPWLDDGAAISSYWHEDSTRLFGDIHDIRIRMIDVGDQYYIIRNEAELPQHLELPRSGTRVFIIPQVFSWGSLMMTEWCARTLLSHLKAFPPFLDILHSFGQRNEPSNETLGCFRTQSRRLVSSHERCYLLKCVERHGRDNMDSPWSIRQFGVYNDSPLSGDDTFVVVNPSASSFLSRKMQALQNVSSDPPTPEMIHLIMISAASSKWSEYISWLEQTLSPLAVKAYICKDENKGGIAGSSLQVTTSDMQQLQVLQNMLNQAMHVVNMNRSTISALVATLWPSYQRGGLSTEAEFGVERCQMCLSDLKDAKRRLKTLLGRSDAISNLMHNIISTRSLATLHASSRMTAEMAELAGADNKLMLSIAAESRRDSRTLKTITVLTLAYLPASFVSTMLGMEYISIKSSDGHWSMQFKPEMWIFAVLSILLVVLTFGFWHGFDLRRTKREERMCREKGLDPELGWHDIARVESWQSSRLDEKKSCIHSSAVD